MRFNFNKVAYIFYLIILILTLKTTVNAQEGNGAVEFEKEELMSILYKHNFPNFYIEPNIPEKFKEKQVSDYWVPNDETIVAFVDGSGSGKGKVKTGIAVGLKGLYIKNSSASYSPGTRFISYSKLKEHEIWTIKSGYGDLLEIKIEFITIEIRGLSAAEREKFQDMITVIKNKMGE